MFLESDTVNIRASQMAPVVKNPPTYTGDMRHGFDPWVRKIPWKRKWQLTRVFSLCLWENPTDRGAWWATERGLAKSETWLSTHTHTNHLRNQSLATKPRVYYILKKSVISEIWIKEYCLGNMWRESWYSGHKISIEWRFSFLNVLSLSLLNFKF